MARNKRKDIEAMPGQRTLFDNQLFAQEPTMALRGNGGLTTRILKTCCMGAAASSTKSPMGSKPRVQGGWEDCPAFDLEPLDSRQASAIGSVTTQQPRQALKNNSSDNRSTYYLQLKQVPVGEAEQIQPGSLPDSPLRTPAVKALSGPEPSVAASTIHTANYTTTTPPPPPGEGDAPPSTVLTPVVSIQEHPQAAAATAAKVQGGSGGHSRPPPLSLLPPSSPRDSAADMMYGTAATTTSTGEYETFLPTGDSPRSQSPVPPAQRPSTAMQHRVALRLLERRGVLPDGGRSTCSPGSGSGSGSGSGFCGSSLAADGGLPTASSQRLYSPTSPQLSLLSPPPAPPLSPGLGSSAVGSPITPALGSPTMCMSPGPVARTSNGTEYYSALGSPAPSGVAGLESPARAAGGGAAGDVETVVEVDERLCLQEEEYDPLDVRGEAYRMSAPGLGLRSAAWGGPEGMGIGGGGAAAAARNAGGAAAANGRFPAIDSVADDLVMRMRGSDFGIAGGTVPEAVYVRARGLRAAAATANGELQHPHSPLAAAAAGDGTPRSAVILVSPDGADDPGSHALAAGGGGGTLRRGTPPPAWSAAGGRDELSQEEKEWLFGQPGGIGGLAPVVALGEGGEGLVDLVRLTLPGRTVHLARKATRTCLPVFALSTTTGAAAAVLAGVRSQQKVSYRFPFEFFDREVKAMKAVKDSGFVIRFQAASYDHEAGQGFILMEAAPYGTLEDLHAALCRSQLQPRVQRQRPALLQRAFAKFNFTHAKSSAPPSLLGGGGGGGTPNGSVRGGKTAAQGSLSSPHSPRSGGGGGGFGSGGGAAALEGSVADPDGGGGGVCCPALSAAAPSGDGGGGPMAAGVGGGGVGTMHIAALGSSLMSTRALRYYGACMLQALVALHEAGYVYRDLKLSNVLVCEGGRVRLTDFGAATPCLPDRPGLFGGAAGTRAYLAPEVLPWLERSTAKGGKHSSGGGSGGPEPYTITVDSWTWGLMMVELATGWSLKELTQRVIRRVYGARGSETPDLPPDCGLPPALRQLLLDHVLVRDPRERWPAARIRSHPFFQDLDWTSLAEAEGPHAHLFGRGRLVNAPAAPVQDSPDAVAAAMLEGEMMATAARRGSRPTGLASPVAVLTAAAAAGNLPTAAGLPMGCAAEAAICESVDGMNTVVPFGNQRSSRPSSRQPSYTGNGGGFGAPSSPKGLISATGMFISPTGGGVAGGFQSPAGGVRQFSSPGNGPLIGPVVLAGSSAMSPSQSSYMAPELSSGLAAAAGIAVGARRHTLQGAVGSSRLSSGSHLRHSPAPPPPPTPPPAALPTVRQQQLVAVATAD
ncbi:hypothetical protein VOLCADRAFT_99693 [Volvox carteri f. nagariensis]|uniref:Protein kinase domain-containing protein n=1 Tax=Volvox carteri f. nagariensis TaxID=3068 RepID=D8UIE2_VOLCA|nr:uncharacterized protein VOLCADRAFT_99693 [Volvox carteri f. nagariensis]EFJ40495.1 hypothetical protein VOLCADRAFT_99693 [Volvox carteri f. nagariensis]|eukprot:XP_002958419.1 hypothetical protein VOLCADRAFT_99693 [Volvox carteri f. nagariensis]